MTIRHNCDTSNKDKLIDRKNKDVSPPLCEFSSTSVQLFSLPPCGSSPTPPCVVSLPTFIVGHFPIGFGISNLTIYPIRSSILIPILSLYFHKGWDFPSHHLPNSVLNHHLPSYLIPILFPNPHSYLPNPILNPHTYPSPSGVDITDPLFGSYHEFQHW